jgi:hypothetical protein
VVSTNVSKCVLFALPRCAFQFLTNRLYARLATHTSLITLILNRGRGWGEACVPLLDDNLSLFFHVSLINLLLV